MSKIIKKIPLPLDEEGFLRRECPFCHKEFKILFEKQGLANLLQKSVDSFIAELKGKKANLSENSKSENEFICPYCGQRAPSNDWWTREQASYIHNIFKNIIAKAVNENLINSFKESFQSFRSDAVSIKFEGKEMEQHEPRISPEINDMKIFDLPCCQRKIKIEENWHNKVYCFFCGFPHEYKK